ncbi:hypothetical protein PR048_009216 [Dryococelus australis]|uniref:Uncharacterized protein n=1 Tax=Dryococelus australis TaxID=614101 RepID=A0ABQ9HZ96_9NEOP|nr:hypothetical protein PR048_009216 [Dryococelus australis]
MRSEEAARMWQQPATFSPRAASSDLVCTHLRTRLDTAAATKGWERRWNARAGETGVTRESPPVSGIVQHDPHMRNPGSEPAGYRTRFTLVGSKWANRSATAAPSQ